MKRFIKIIVLVAAIAFVAAQFIRPDQTAAPIVRAETLEATTQIPEDVAAVFKRSCNDCHTNETIYPWYSNITPVNWLLASHIDEGRHELNFSAWNTYSGKKKNHKLDEICEQVRSGEMPHNQYLWMHGDAELSDNDKRIICRWVQSEKAKIAESQ